MSYKKDREQEIIKRHGSWLKPIAEKWLNENTSGYTDKQVNSLSVLIIDQRQAERNEIADGY